MDRIPVVRLTQVVLPAWFPPDPPFLDASDLGAVSDVVAVAALGVLRTGPRRAPSTSPPPTKDLTAKASFSPAPPDLVDSFRHPPMDGE